MQGLPKEWQRLLNDSGITKKEQEQNPQTIVDIVTFYKDNTEKNADEHVWEKFDHAQPSDPQVRNGTMSPGAMSPIAPQMISNPSYTAMTPNPMMSPPSSPQIGRAHV